MIRVLFWVLLVANIGFLSAMQWGGQLWGESVVAQPELNAEKMRLLDAEKIIPTVGGTGPTGDQESLPDNFICLEWGEFSDEELKLVNSAMSDLSLEGKLSKREVEYEIKYWVFIPPLKDKAATSEKISQLKERDVSEYFIVQEAGIWQNAISLGVFKTQEAAQSFLTALRAKGVRSAQVGERGSKLKINILRFNEVDTATEAKLTELQRNFTGSELNSVQCGLTR
jgi:hypothetical protein